MVLYLSVLLYGLQIGDRLVGLVVKMSASKAEDPGFDFRLRCGDFFPG